MLGVVAVIVVGHLLQLRQPENHAGTTTDMAMLMMFGVGVYLVVGPMVVAVAVGGSVAVLLQFKGELHGIAKKLGDEDLRAIMQFVLISCIILPVLPNHNFGPSKWFGFTDSALDVFNPFETWLMVVLIVGMSLGGYIVYKFFRQQRGYSAGRRTRWRDFQHRHHRELFPAGKKLFRRPPHRRGRDYDRLDGFLRSSVDCRGRRFAGVFSKCMQTPWAYSWA